MDTRLGRRGMVLGVIATLLLAVAMACGTEEVIITATPGPTQTPRVEEVIREVPSTPIIKEVIKLVEGTPVVVQVEVTPTPTSEPTLAPPPAPPAKKNPGMFVAATIGDISSLDPAWQYDNDSWSAVFNVYETLLFYKREKLGEFVPVLSTGWDISEDGQKYTFTIRDGVSFHEGGTLEPHDVAYSIWRGLLQDRAGGPQWILLDPLLEVSGIKALATQIAGVGEFAAVDDSSLVQTCQRVKEAVTFDDANRTVTFNLSKPFGPFLQILGSGWGSIVDQEWMIEQGAWDADCGTWTKWHDPAAEESVIFQKMNGTGPFKFERWRPAEEWSLVRNESYWLKEPLWEGGPSGPAALDRVVVKVVPEWGTRLTMFKAGDADWVFVPNQFVVQMDPLVKEEFEGGERDAAKLTIRNPNGGARVFTNLPVVSATDAFFTFNVDTEGGNPFVGSGALDGLGIPPDFFSDIHVRKAFSHAFDYQTFIDDIWLGEAIQRTGPIISGHIGYSPDQPVYSFDLKAAEAEFKLAFDGKLWDTGFFLVVIFNTGNDQRRVAAEILKHNIESMNPKFKIAIQDFPGPTFFSQIVSSSRLLKKGFYGRETTW